MLYIHWRVYFYAVRLLHQFFPYFIIAAATEREKQHKQQQNYYKIYKSRSLIQNGMCIALRVFGYIPTLDMSNNV